MSWGEHHFDEMFDPRPGDEEDRVVECRVCGMPCYWQMTDYGWRLYEDGEPHACDVSDDFEVLE